jgi:hypothetical protein
MEPADDVLVHREDGEAFLLHVASGRYFGLNRTGLLIWEALVAGDDPAAALQARWPDLDPATCAADVDALLRGLLATGLLRSTGGDLHGASP